MLKNLFTLVLSFLCFSSFASTNVSGIISGNVTWTKANSPYIVTGNLLVDSTCHLTIEPGVEVRGGKFNFYIDGALSANGTSSDNITFTSNTQNDTWYGLAFRKKHITDTCFFNFCKFLHAGNKSLGCASIKIDSRSIMVKNCVFDSGSYCHLYLQNIDYISVDSSVFKRTSMGICLSGYNSGQIINTRFEKDTLGIYTCIT